jgi:hypothetical protein
MLKFKFNEIVTVTFNDVLYWMYKTFILSW